MAEDATPFSPHCCHCPHWIVAGMWWAVLVPDADQRNIISSCQPMPTGYARTAHFKIQTKTKS
jgi:hypothetical protein